MYYCTCFSNTCEFVVENIIVLKDSTAIIEYAYSSFFTIVDVVSSEDRVTIRLDPHTG